MFVCFSIFFSSTIVRKLDREISWSSRYQIYVITGYRRAISFINKSKMFFRKEASSVNNSVELMCLSSQGVWAQRTHLGEVEKGQHVSASHHPGAVDYATMLWLARAPYQMTTNSHILEVRAMPTEFHINWTLNPSWFQFYCKTTSLWVTTAPLPDKRKYFQKLSNVFKFQEHTQTNLYAKVSALNILFPENVGKRLLRGYSSSIFNQAGISYIHIKWI